MKTISLPIAAALLLSVVAFACGTPTDGTCEETSSCTPYPDAGGDGQGDGPVVPADCDLSKGLKDSPSCIADQVGVFVSPGGNDGAAGTKASPLGTIAKGVEVAASRGLPRV